MTIDPESARLPGELSSKIEPDDIVVVLREYQSLTEHEEPLHEVFRDAADEIERLRSFVDTDLSLSDLEMKVRDGSVFIDMRTDKGFAMRLLASLMLHWVLGEDNEEPPNYRSGEVAVRPAGTFAEYRAFVEVVKPGGKSSHQIRTELEAELATLRCTQTSDEVER